MADPHDAAALAARFRQALMPLVRQLRTQVPDGMTPGLMSALATVARVRGPTTLVLGKGAAPEDHPLVRAGLSASDGNDMRALACRVHGARIGPKGAAVYITVHTGGL